VSNCSAYQVIEDDAERDLEASKIATSPDKTSHHDRERSLGRVKLPPAMAEAREKELEAAMNALDVERATASIPDKEMPAHEGNAASSGLSQEHGEADAAEKEGMDAGRGWSQSTRMTVSAVSATISLVSKGIRKQLWNVVGQTRHKVQNSHSTPHGVGLDKTIIVTVMPATGRIRD